MNNQKLSKELDDLYSNLEDYVIQDIARRLKKAERWTETAELMSKAMKEQGYSPAKIQREVLKHIRADKAYKKFLANNTNQYKKMVEQKIAETIAAAKAAGNKLISKAGTMQWNNNMAVFHQGAKGKGMSKAGKRLVKLCAAKVDGDTLNLTKTIAFRLGKAYTPAARMFGRAVNQALVNTATGVVSSSESTRRIARELIRKGMSSLNYESGATINTKAGVRRCLRSSLGLLSNQIGEQNAKELRTDLVEVNRTGHPRTGNGGEDVTNHAWWEGRVYSRSGRNYEGTGAQKALGYKILPLSVTGWPSDPRGLGGYNCGHEMYPYIHIGK